MKRLIVLIAALLVTPAFAGEAAKEHHALTTLPPAFEHLKSLVGTWEGVGTGDSKGTTTFEIVASGSAIMERMAPMGEPPMRG